MASVNEMINLNQYQAGPGRFTNQGGGGGIVDLLAGMMQAKQIKEEKAMKKQKNQADMYKTLRDSGYEPKKAYEAVMSGKLPDEAGGDTVKEKIGAANVNRINAQTEKIKTKPANSVRQQIVDKVAAGEDLTPGEQKVYDEVIRKYGQKSDLSSVLQNKADKIDQTNPDDYVPMIDPSGKNKRVPKANVEKAKARGWKLR